MVAAAAPSVPWRWLGKAEYRAVLDEQLAERERVWAGAEGTIFLCEHPAVITLGRSANTANVLAAGDVPLERIERGGDVTYHGPGQLVGYPIVNLDPDRRDVHQYVRDIEEVMIRVCADYGVAAGRIAGLTGTWVGAEKIGAIGVRLSRWITSHGFAFNVSTNLDHFKLIVPCGISDRGVTSLECATGRQLSIDDVEDAFLRRFGEVFGRELAHVPLTTG